MQGFVFTSVAYKNLNDKSHTWTAAVAVNFAISELAVDTDFFLAAL